MQAAQSPNQFVTNFFASFEESLERRYTHKPPFSEETVFEITSDVGFLHQYFNLRNDDFFKSASAANHATTKDIFDDTSEIMVARRGRLCVAGGRLTIHTPSSQKALPMEYALSVAQLFPELDLAETTYAEISSIALMPDYRTNLQPELITKLLQHAINSGVEYVFTLTNKHKAEQYQQAAQAIFIKASIYKDPIITMNEGDTNRMTLCVFDLSKQLHHAKKQAQGKSLLNQ